MDALTIAKHYYDAWIHRAGDMSGVPLADDFTFTGPVATFSDAAGYRAMARQAGAAVRRFEVRHQFVQGHLICSIVDWEMDPLPGTLTAAELLHIRDGRLVRGELIYDAEELRRAMTGPTNLVGLLRHSYGLTTELLGRVTADGWPAPSPCDGWTVRQTADHLTGGLLLLTRVAEGEAVDPAEFDAQRQADTDHLGSAPATAFEAVAERSLAAFGKPGMLEKEFPFPTGPAPGTVLVSLSLLESLVHGWDIARGAGAGYAPSPDLVEAAWSFARQGIGEAQRHAGLFAAPILTSPDADPFTRLLAYLGRQP